MRDGECMVWERLRSQGCRTSHLIDGVSETDALKIDKVTTCKREEASMSTKNIPSVAAAVTASVTTHTAATSGATVTAPAVTSADITTDDITAGATTVTTVDDVTVTADVTGTVTTATVCSNFETTTDIEDSDGTQLESDGTQLESEEDDDEEQKEEQTEVSVKGTQEEEGKNEFWLGRELSACIPQLLKQVKARRNKPLRHIPSHPFFHVSNTPSLSVSLFL